MSLSEVRHQGRAHRLLQRALASARMPHAYLFAGPEGVGRELLALRLAQLLLCPHPVRRVMPDDALAPAGEPSVTSDGLGLDACGGCADCKLVLAGTHPDLRLIHRQLVRQHPDPSIRKQKALFLGVEVIRHFVIEQVGTRPIRGRAKVFILREAERLNDAAQNSLLKTLEEPPNATFLILVTTGLDRMLPTTRSRCQPVVLSALPASFVADRLSALRPNLPTTAAGYIARRCGGSLGEALRQADDGLYELQRTWAGHLAELISPRSPNPPHALAGPFQQDAKSLAKAVADRDPDVSDTDALRGGLQSLLAVLGDFYADAMRHAIGSSAEPIHAEQGPLIARLAAMGPSALEASLTCLAGADADLARNAHVELTCEALFLRLAALAHGQPLPSPAGSAG